MRLGVLECGGLEAGITEPLLSALRASDIDVVAGEAAITSLDTAVQEARRLARADCDGVLLAVGTAAGTEPCAAVATLLAGVPLLLAGPPAAALFEAAGALEEIGAFFERLPTDQGFLTAPVLAWLRENAKTQRHPGLEAARKLYGQRLYLAGTELSSRDYSHWVHQFGVFVTGQAENADFAATDGDLYGALTRQLLALVSAGETLPGRFPVYAPGGNEPVADEMPVTFARLSRRAGRFRCLLLRGALRDGGASVSRFDCPPSGLLSLAASPWLHAVPGDHLGAMRAACHALDIEPLVLRPA